MLCLPACLSRMNLKFKGKKEKLYCPFKETSRTVLIQADRLARNFVKNQKRIKQKKNHKLLFKKEAKRRKSRKNTISLVSWTYYQIHSLYVACFVFQFPMITKSGLQLPSLENSNCFILKCFFSVHIMPESSHLQGGE